MLVLVPCQSREINCAVWRVRTHIRPVNRLNELDMGSIRLLADCRPGGKQLANTMHRAKTRCKKREGASVAERHTPTVADIGVVAASLFVGAWRGLGLAGH